MMPVSSGMVWKGIWNETMSYTLYLSDLVLCSFKGFLFMLGSLVLKMNILNCLLQNACSCPERENSFATMFCYQKKQQGGHGTGKTGNLVITFSRQGKHGEFRYNTGKIWTTQGIFQISLKMKYFLVNCPFIDWWYPQFFSGLTFLSIFPQTFFILVLSLHIYVQSLVWHVKLNM